MKVPLGYLWKSLKEHASHLSELLVLDSNPQLSLQKNISNIDTSTCCPWDYCSRDVGCAIHQMCNIYHDTPRGAGNGCLPDVESSLIIVSTLIVSLLLSINYSFWLCHNAMAFSTVPIVSLARSLHRSCFFPFSADLHLLLPSAQLAHIRG